MNSALWKKGIRESYLLLVGCGSVLFLFCWVRVWITSRLEMGKFQEILESLPNSWQKLAPVPIDQLFSYEGRIAVTYEEPIVYLMMAIWAIARSSDSVSGGLASGTMEMLLAQPVSRLQVLLTHTWITLLGVVALAAIAFTGTYVGIATSHVVEPGAAMKVPLLGVSIPFTQSASVEVPMLDRVSPWIYLPAALNYLGLGVFLVGLTSFLSSWDRYRWRTIGLAVSFYVIETILELVGLAADGYGWVKRLTFFAAYEPVRFVTEATSHAERRWAWLVFSPQGEFYDLGPLGYDAVLLGLGASGILAACVVFCRRDLPAPL